MKIIAFSFAGGSKYSYQQFTKNIPGFVVIECPGRGTRINENLIDNIDLLIDDLIKKVREEIEFEDEYIIYGHSMGALLGYLICHKLKEYDLRLPLKLIVSGKKAPSIKRDKILSHLDDDDFWKEVIKIGGIPNELQTQLELMNFYIPIIKSDFKTIEDYRYKDRGKLEIPIDVFYGKAEEITLEEMREWQNESIKKVSITQLDGDHFFIFPNANFFINYFNNLNKSSLLYIHN